MATYVRPLDGQRAQADPEESEELKSTEYSFVPVPLNRRQTFLSLPTSQWSLPRVMRACYIHRPKIYF